MSRKQSGVQTTCPVSQEIPTPAGGVRLETFIPWTLVSRRVRREVITPLDAPQEFAVEAGGEREAREVAQDSALLRALGLAHHWQRLLDEGRYRTMTEIAAAEDMDLGQACRVAQLARLAPHVVERCLGSQGSGLALEPLVRHKLPILWQAQQERTSRDHRGQPSG
jgi:hypothetical protein